MSGICVNKVGFDFFCCFFRRFYRVGLTYLCDRVAIMKFYEVEFKWEG